MIIETRTESDDLSWQRPLPLSDFQALAEIRSELSLSEIQITALAVHGKLCTPCISDLVRQVLAEPGYVRRCADQLGSSSGTLIDKLKRLDSRTHLALTFALHQFWLTPLAQIDAHDDALPASEVLARHGLVPVDDQVAWGICIAVQPSGDYVEYILHNNADGLVLPEAYPEDEEIDEAVFGGRGDRVAVTDAGHLMAYRIARAKGLQRFRIERSPDGRIGTHRCAIGGLLSDLIDGSMAPILLAGVNAPDLR